MLCLFGPRKKFKIQFVGKRYTGQVGVLEKIYSGTLRFFTPLVPMYFNNVE